MWSYGCDECREHFEWVVKLSINPLIAKPSFLKGEGVGVNLIKSFYIQNQLSKTREKILSVSYKRDA